MYKLGHEEVVHKSLIKMRSCVQNKLSKLPYVQNRSPEEACVQNRSPEVHAREAIKYVEINLPRKSKGNVNERSLRTD